MKEALALHQGPLHDGGDSAGYLPPPYPRAGRKSHVVGALSVIGEIETFALGFRQRAQPHQNVDHLVEDHRTDAGPDARSERWRAALTYNRPC
jgi:hypothetical protein